MEIGKKIKRNLAPLTRILLIGNGGFEKFCYKFFTFLSVYRVFDEIFTFWGTLKPF